MSSISLTLGLRGRLLSGTQTTLQGALFGNGEPGFTFEPWDITTLYQDRAGTTPVTDAGQSVGLRLSKDQGLRQGPELVTNGDFSTDTWWGKDATCTIGGGTGNFSATPASSGFFKSDILQVGKFYRVTYTIVSISGGAIRILLGAGSSIVRSVAGTYTEIIQCAGSGNLYAQAFSGGPTTASVDNISVRELAGNHEVAVSDAKRGVYGWMPKTGRRNQLTYTEDLTNAAWTKTNVVAASAVRLTYNGGSTPTTAYLQQNIAIVGGTASKPFTVRAVLSGSGKIRLKNSQVGVLDNYSTDIVLTGTPTPYTLTVTNGASAGTGVQSFGLNPATDNSAFDVTVSEFQPEQSAAPTAYQRVVSQYDITEAGVPTCYYVQADGVDDAYVTPTITPNTDKAQVFAGVRKLTDSAAYQVIIESSASLASNNGAFVLAPNVGTYELFSKGTVQASAPASGYSAPVTNVITGLGDISGDTATLRVNGSQVAQSTADQGTGNYLAYPAYIYSRGGTSLPFNGLDFGHAVRFGPNLDAATIARVESLIARNTPEVTL